MASKLKLEVGRCYKNAHGEKIGPIADHQWSDGFPYHGGRGMGFYNAHGIAQSSQRPDLIAEWTDSPTGPVRTVTRKEIMPGDYGDVCVSRTGSITCVTTRDPVRIRAAIATLTEIADALEEQA